MKMTYNCDDFNRQRPGKMQNVEIHCNGNESTAVKWMVGSLQRASVEMSLVAKETSSGQAKSTDAEQKACAVCGDLKYLPIKNCGQPKNLTANMTHEYDPSDFLIKST
jgi:hypothetical protein